MRRLLVDAGNTRVKWAVQSPDGLGPMRAASIGDDLTTLFRDGPFDEAVVVDVRGTIHARLAEKLPTRRLTASAHAAGVRNAYREPAALGADRWAALMGLRGCVTGAACVADAGTALTFDMLAADGTHLGGWIVPGVRLSAAALEAGTRGIRLPATVAWELGPGTDTGSAVAGGAVLAAVGFVQTALKHAQAALGVEPTLVVTGGDAAMLARACPEAILVDDLVLRGAAAWAETD